LGFFDWMQIMKPHRGTMILVFGILGLVVCAIFAPVAWIMANADLKEMESGQMDPAGKDLTNIGRILGIIGTIFIVIACLGGIVIFLLNLAAIGASNL
jgi:hypothetical protein